MCAPRYGASDFGSRWGVCSKYMVPMLCCSSLRKPPAKQKPNHWWAPGVSVETPLHLAKQSKPSHTKPTGQDVTKIFSRTMPNHAKPIKFNQPTKLETITTLGRLHRKIDRAKAGRLGLKD